MDVMPNGRGMGRGRGRGKQMSMPNSPIMDCTTSPINPPGEQSSIVNGVAMTRGRGRGHGFRARAIVPVAPSQYYQPDVAFGSNQDGPPRISEEDIKAIKKILQSTMKPMKKSKSEQRSLCKMWTYPRGITRPIMVLSMNEYLSTEELFIPGEISLAPFTLKDGVDLLTTYWTLVDPSKDIPPEYQNEVNNNATNFGLPQSKTCVNARYYQNYVRIVEEIEAFIQANSEPMDPPKDREIYGDGDTHVIFCQKEFVSGYTSGLDWLYSLAGKEKFPHKLVALESVLVMLSHGGLRNQAERKGFRDQTFSQVLTSFSHAVGSITRRNVDKSSPTPQHAIEVMNAEVQFILSKLRDSFVSRTRFTQYITLGEKAARLAGRRVLEHPHVFLGAFLSEGQATRYLLQKDYTNKDHLACGYHQDTEQMWKCARFNVARMIYTVLDVLLANYEIEPREGHHFPKFSYYTFI